MRSTRFWNGVVLILAGALLLALNQGWVNTASWRDIIADWWPVGLIALGVAVLLTGSGPSFGVLLLVALVVFGSYVYSSFGAGFRHVRFGAPRAPARSQVFEEPLPPGVTNATVTLTYAGGRLSIDGDAQGLAAGRLTYFEVKPAWSAVQKGSAIDLVISQGQGERIPAGEGSHSWRLSLTDRVPVDVSIRAGAASADLDFRKVKLRTLDISCGAASLVTRFPEEPQMRASIRTGAASLEIHVPAAVGLKINNPNSLLSNSLENQGLQRSGNSYVSKDFGTAKSNLEIDLTTAASSVRIFK
jgi:hypothetical protein